MDWNIREKVLGYFVDFVVGEIDEIENIISWADARNHPETVMNKICQIVVARQKVVIYARDVLMEQTKLPDRWALFVAAANTFKGGHFGSRGVVNASFPTTIFDHCKEE